MSHFDHAAEALRLTLLDDARDSLNKWEAKQRALRGIDGDDFCPRCGLPLNQCLCKTRAEGTPPGEPNS